MEEAPFLLSAAFPMAVSKASKALMSAIDAPKMGQNVPNSAVQNRHNLSLFPAS
jgi:hypothetical protein